MTRLVLLVTSEKLDRLCIAANLSAAAAAMGWSTRLFFTFWGLLALIKGRPSSGVSRDYATYEPPLRSAVESGKLPTWVDLIRQAKEVGDVEVYACYTTMDLLSVKREELEDFVDDVVGAATFLSIAQDSDVTLVI